MRGEAIRIGRCFATLTVSLLASGSTVSTAGTPPPFNHDQLLTAKAAGNVEIQRDHIWRTLSSLVTSTEGDACPAFAQWHGETETFHPAESWTISPSPGLTATTGGDKAIVSATMAGGPLITFIHYNDAAYAHIRENRLHDKATLDRLLAEERPDTSVPPLPRDAMVAMTAWWPVSGRQATPLPVWDPARQVRVDGANGYLSWPRVLAVVANPLQHDSDVGPLAFAGRTIEDPEPVSLEQMFHLAVDARMARQLMADPQFEAAAFIALGRPLAAGDFIALVGLHLMTAELDSGIWSTFWWHDRPTEGRFAAGRPESLSSPWDHYLMDVTFDARLPLEPDGSPNISFNPWFDATFPDDGEGSGVKANCISCHQRAAYPVTRSMRVTRGLRQPSQPSGQLPTGLLWSIANTARTGPSEPDQSGISTLISCP